MKRGCLVAGLVVLAVVVIGVLLFAWRYGLLFPAPAVSHVEFAPSRTVFRGRVAPELGGDVLNGALAARTGAPAWVLPWVLPRELAVLCDPDLNDPKTAVVMFVNERRAGRLIADAANRGRVLVSGPRMTWEPEALVFERRGVLRAAGTMPVPAEVVDLVRTHWGVVAPLTPLALDETPQHLFEGVLDLRDGRGFALLAQLIDPDTPRNSPVHPSQLVYLLKKVSEMRLWADLTGPDTLHVHLEMICRPDLDEQDAASTAFLLNAITGQLQENAAAAGGLRIEGRAASEALEVTGDYTVRGAMALLGL